MKLIHIENKIDPLEIKQALDNTRRETAVEILKMMRETYGDFYFFTQDTNAQRIAERYNINLLQM